MSSEIIRQGNSLASLWAGWMGHALLDAAIVLVAVSLVWLAIRRKASPQLGYLLFLLVLAKLFIPLEIAVPERMVSWMPTWGTESLEVKLASPTDGLAGPTVPPAAEAASRQAAIAASPPLPVEPDDHLAATAPSSVPLVQRSVGESPKVSLRAWLMLAWALGCIGLLAKLVHSQFRFLRIARKARPVDPAQLGVDLDRLLRCIGVGQRIRIVESDVLSSPAVSGIVRPTLILPAGIVAALSTMQLEWVLLHELAHVRRRDLAVNCCQRLVAILHFPNPAVWLANHIINRLREYACDDMASALGQASQVESGEAFLGVMRHAASHQRRRETNLAGSLGLFESIPRAFSMRRMARLLDTDRRVSVRLGLGSLAILLVTATLALPQIRAATQPAAEKKADPRNAASAAAEPKTEPHGEARFELLVVGPGGKPVPEASVEIRGKVLSNTDQIERGQFVRKGDYRTFVRTDAAGRLVLGLPKRPRHLDVKIQQPGYGPYWATWHAESRFETLPTEFTAELDAGWSVGGVIVDGEGAAIEGVKVQPSIDYKKRPGDTQRLGVGTNIETDAEGKWRFDSVPVSMKEVFVEISRPDFKPLRRRLTRSEFEVSPGGQPAAKIDLERGLVVTGRVTGEAGKPIAGALIRTKFLNDIREARTNENGDYQLVGCEPRMARIVVSAKGRATDMKEVRVEPDMEPVDFQMQPGGKVRIRILDAQSNPVAKARIFFQRWRGMFEYFEFDHVSQYADDEGVWQWNEAPLDEFQADICPPNGMQLLLHPLVAREEEYVIRLPIPLVISGHVVDADTKEPVRSFRVVPGIRSTPTHMNWARGESYMAADGQYQMRPDRAYLAHLVRIEAEGYQVAVSREIKSDEGEVQIDFELVKGKDVAATVVTSDGYPAANAKVALGIAGSQITVINGEIEEGPTYARQDTDDEGRFRFPAQDAAFQLVITHPTGFAYLKSSEQPIPGTIRLTPWARVEGTFRVGSQPKANVPITLNVESVHSYGEGVPSVFTHHDVTTGTDGRFVFERMFPGNGHIGRRIMLMVDQGAVDVTSATMVAATFPAGETTQIDLGGSGRPVVGKLLPPAEVKEKVLWNFAMVEVRTDLSEPTPPPAPKEVQKDPQRQKDWWDEWRATDAGKAWGMAYDAYKKQLAASPVVWATVDRDGSFRLDDMPAGDYVLCVRFDQHPAGHLANCRFSVPPIEGGRTGEPLDLGELVLQGR